MEIITVKPRTWTLVGGVQVWHDYGAARQVEVYGGRAGVVLTGEWQVRPAPATPRPAPHVVEHRTMRAGGEVTGTTADPFGPPSKAPVPDRPGPVFLAAFATECPECGQDVEEGDRARMTPDGAVHAECVEPDDGTSYADGIPS